MNEIKMFPYSNQQDFMSPKINRSKTPKPRTCFTPNAIFAMCRERGANIVKQIIPITWKSYNL